MPRRERYIVELIRPEGVSVAEMKEYIDNAVSSWCGQFEPPNEDNNYTGNPLFDLSSSGKIKVFKERHAAANARLLAKATE